MTGAVKSLTLPRSLLRSGWRTRHFVAAIVLGILGILATIDAWSDLLRIAWNDEESSQIWLVIPVVVWLLWVRRGRLRHISPTGMWIGPILVAIGAVFYIWGKLRLIDVFWHVGAVSVLIGCVLTPLGWQLFRNFGVVFLAMAFLVPVPARIRQRIAIPLQSATANATSEVCQLVGMDVQVSGNLLRVNGHNVAVAEACNGMRMTFALLMVCFAFAYTIPLRGYVRILVLLMSPFSAIACNVVRLVPTVWVYGNYEQSTAEVFHDASGWVMLFVAFLLLLGIIRLLRWAMLPVMSFTLAYD
jgi:exosortase